MSTDVSTAPHFAVEVAYALPERQCCLTVSVPAGSTIRTAIERSRIQEQFGDIDLAKNAVGVWGRLRSVDDLVNPGDRIEIYRALSVDPKEARRRKAGHP